MLSSASQYPIFGPEIPCPHCRKPIAALTLTDTYLCQRHGAFEANPETQELTHLQSNRVWREWEGEWYRQHTHPDGIRFEIHEALDRLYTEGFRATRVVVACRYKFLISAYLERYNRQVMAHQALYSASVASSNVVPSNPSKNLVAGTDTAPKTAAAQYGDRPNTDPIQSTSQDASPAPLKLYGLPVSFSPEGDDPRWDVINFALEKEAGLPARYPYFRMFEQS